MIYAEILIIVAKIPARLEHLALFRLIPHGTAHAFFVLDVLTVTAQFARVIVDAHGLGNTLACLGTLIEYCVLAASDARQCVHAHGPRITLACLVAFVQSCVPFTSHAHSLVIADFPTFAYAYFLVVVPYRAVAALDAHGAVVAARTCSWVVTGCARARVAGGRLDVVDRTGEAPVVCVDKAPGPTRARRVTGALGRPICRARGA